MTPLKINLFNLGQSAEGLSKLGTLNPEFPTNSPSQNIVSSKSSVTNLMLQSGLHPTTHSDIKEVLSVLSNKGYHLNQDSVQTIQQFMRNQPGSVEDKLATVQALAQKNLEITPTNLSSIYEALKGVPVSTVLHEFLQDDSLLEVEADIHKEQEEVHLLKHLKNHPDFKKMVEAIESEQSLSQELKNEILKALKQIEMADFTKLKQMDKGIMDLILYKWSNLTTSTNSYLSDLQKMFLSAVKDVQSEASFAKVLDALKLIIAELPNETELVEAFERASREASQGRELTARKELSQALNQISDENAQLQNAIPSVTLSSSEQYLINEAVQSLQLDSKTIVVTEITKKLSQLAIDFKKMRQDISKNLEQITGETKQVNQNQMKHLLEASIKKLDNAILKGDYLLYTDMRTEKKLLTASSQLAEAKNLLTKGNHAEARLIVKEVKTLIDQLTFKPSEVRVKHFVSKQSLKELLPAKQIATEFQQAIKPFPEQDQSARRIFETIRRLGLTNENELVQALSSSASKGEQDLPSNLKSTLLKMMQEEGTGKHTQPIEQALSSLTGQQLLSKHDSNGIQSLFMQLPLLLNKQVENVKVYLNSNNKDGKIDWENCSLYFVLETRKLGDIGILVTATNRNLSITLKNNREQFQEKMELLTDTAVERLNDIGYNVSSIQFKPFTTDRVDETMSAVVKTDTITDNAADHKKGYDFTV